MSLTLKDLRVATKLESGEYIGGSTPASLADLVEVLKQEKAIQIYSCEAHLSRMYGPGEGDVCEFGQLYPSAASFCRMREVLILPLGDTP